MLSLNNSIASIDEFKLDICSGNFLKNEVASCFNVLLFVRQEAYGCCSSMSAAKGWALYYLRPKIHMYCHILFLSCRLGMILVPFLVYVLNDTALAKPA